MTSLGKQIGQGQVFLLDDKISAIPDCPVSTTRRELQRFFWMASYYRCFCGNPSVLVAPLAWKGVLQLSCSSWFLVCFSTLFFSD